jgi:20S proteasome subunit beta 4
VQCNTLFAGVDATGPSLYYFDNLGSMVQVDYSAHGYCSNFCLSILDKQFRTNLSQAEARDIMLACVGQLKQRFLIHMPRFLIKTVGADGVTSEEVD